MTLLNRLFGSSESVAVEIETDSEKITSILADYISTLPKKIGLIDKLDPNKINLKDIQELNKLLDLELVEIKNLEVDEVELIADLESIEHDKKIKRIHKLEQALFHAATRYQYVYQLLEQIYIILTKQKQIIIRLLDLSTEAEVLVHHLKLQLDLEVEVVEVKSKLGPSIASPVNSLALYSALVRHLGFPIVKKQTYFLPQVDHKGKPLEVETKKGVLRGVIAGMGNFYQSDSDALVLNDSCLPFMRSVHSLFGELGFESRYGEYKQTEKAYGDRLSGRINLQNKEVDRLEKEGYIYL